MTREEAIEVVRKNLPHLGIGATEMTDALETLIPELRESEDERIRKWMVELVENQEPKMFIEVKKMDVFAWIEKQKEQKPAEWSEEDEAMRDNILRLLSCFVGTLECDSNPSLSASYPAYQREMDWLKSLRPSWKPSEEQMDALEAATVRYQSTGLESLYEDLKKL